MNQEANRPWDCRYRLRHSHVRRACRRRLAYRREPARAEAARVTCGGHAAAAGLRIEDSRIAAFREAFLAEVSPRMPAELRQAQLTLDGETTIAGVTLESVRELERLAPFGQGNRRPLLCASGVNRTEPPRTMGGGNKHLALTLVQNGIRIRAVAFGGAEWLPHLPAQGEPFHVAFKPKINEFPGRRTAEMELVDWRPAGFDVTADLPPLAETAG